ncbi:MAG TPA: EAL domain-containing protein [Burkholderiales bacterium]|nr:EAL domain-containing protein [Burkholderiales bacterium]
MSEALRVLFVEDVQVDADLEIRELRRTGMKVDYRRVETEPAFLEAIGDFKPDIILSDFSMPAFDGMAALGIAQANCPHIPFLFVSGTLGEEYAIRALQKGASDYVLKTNLIRLPAAVTRAIAEAKDKVDRRAVQGELERARQQLSSIVEALDDAVWSWAIDEQRLTYIGPASRVIFGRDPEEFCTQPDLWRQVIADDDKKAVVETWRDLLAGTGSFDLEYRIVKADGEIRWINNRARLIAAKDGAPARVDGIIRDVSDRMAARQRISRLTRIRALSSAVNSAIVRLRERKLLLERICEIAIDVGKFDVARVLTIDKASGRVELVAETGARSGKFAGIVARYNANPEGGDRLLSRALKSGQTVIGDTLDTNGPAADGLGEPLRSTTASFPLVIKENIVGTLMLNAADNQVFDQEEIRLLEELTANISFALELIGHQERIDYLAYYDVLTGLSNRTLFNDRLSQALTVSNREGTMLALVVFNVVQLRSINESFGELAGDAVLRELSARLKALSNDPASVARLGGDRFALMIPAVKGLKEVAQQLAEERFRFYETPFNFEDREISLMVRGGVALFPNDGSDADSLLHNAESALDQARKAGETLLFYSADANTRVAERRKVENRLQMAVENQEFELHYQPKLDLHHRKFVGLEALLRWRDPDVGLVPPSDFIYLLEDTGLILEVGRWALKEAVTVRRAWKEAGIDAPRVAVNVSALQLRDRRFIRDVEDALAFSGEDIGLDLEITESMLMENIHEGVTKLRAVRDMDVHIAIDDFGTGYSSLSYISTLPVNTLKIDRSFISGMTEDPAKTSIVTTIISLGHALRMEIVAEGVETDAQSQLLRLLHCDQIQGYLISRPLSREATTMLLRGDKK